MVTYNTADNFIENAEAKTDVCLRIQLNEVNGGGEKTVEGKISLFREGAVDVRQDSQGESYAVHNGERIGVSSGDAVLWNEVGSFDIGCFKSVEVLD